MRFNPNAEILVLDEQGTNLGRMPYRDAQGIASSRNLDLVSINKKEGIEVFRIMDHGKWKYEKKKNKRKQKKSSLPLKEMNFKMRIDPHDQEIKINRIQSFLDKGADVKITVTMRGREKAKPRLAREKMDAIIEKFGTTIQIQQQRGSPSAVCAVIRPVEKKKKDAIQSGKLQRSSGESNVVSNGSKNANNKEVSQEEKNSSSATVKIRSAIVG